MKRLIFLFLTLLSIKCVHAGIMIGDLYYDIDSTTKTATLTYSQYCYVSGDLIIPETVRYNSMDYKVTSIGDYALDGHSGLTSVTIPESVTSIGGYAFSYCSGLTDITIPNSVTSIGVGAFEACSGLTSVTIPNSVTSIGGIAFRDCSGLTSVTIPNSVTSIEICAFEGCSGLTSVTIPNSVTSIGKNAFSGCSGLTSVTIPNSVTSIKDYAFRDCSGLTSVTIPNSVTSIRDWAFSGCRGLKKVEISDLEAWCKIIFGSYYANPLCYAHHLYMNGDEITDLKIPNSVTSIRSYAFYNCSGLTSVTIPNSVTSIGGGAFRGCPIEHLTIDCVNIENWFSNNPSLKELTLGNSVTSIGNSAFAGCSGLTGVTIPNSVTSIRASAFEGCSGLNKVEISDLEAWCKIIFESYDANPLYYAHHLYMNGDEITELKIPNSVTSIRNYAFYNCSGLTSVTIPNSVTSIRNYAFYNCSGLKTITFNSKSVLGLWRSAFSDCNNIEAIYCNTTQRPPAAETFDVFSDEVYSNAKLYVPELQLSLYYTIVPWSKFSNIQGIGDYTEVEINFTGSSTLFTGQNLQLTLSPKDMPYIDLDASWNSSNPEVATVSSSGLVTGVSAGTCQIEATYGDLTATCEITILEDSSVNSIFTDSEPLTIFTINSILVKKDATLEDIQTLSPGIYIINGKKLVVR